MPPSTVTRNFVYRRGSAMFLLGEQGETLIGVEDDRHILTCAGSRSGKGVSAIIPNLLLYPGSAVVIDPKGEAASATARYRKEKLGHTVYILDPFEVVDESAVKGTGIGRSTFNPLSTLEVRSPTLIEDTWAVVDSLIVEGNRDDQYWTDGARSILEGLILHVVATDLPVAKTLTTVRECLFNDAEALDADSGTTTFALLLDMRATAKKLEKINLAASEVLTRSISDYFYREASQLATIQSFAKNSTRFLDLPAMQRVLNTPHKTPGVDIRDLHPSKKTTIFLCLPAGRLGACNRWLRLFINLTLSALERSKLPRSRVDPAVLLIMDEFPVLGHMKLIEDAAGQMAGFGVKLWPIIQDLAQLEALYQMRWQTFLGNAGVLQFFGNNDLKTLQYIQDRLGRTSWLDRQHTLGGTRASEQLANHEHPLITVDEAAELFSKRDRLRRQLVLVGGNQPMILSRLEYFSAKKYFDRYAVSAPSQRPGEWMAI